MRCVFVARSDEPTRSVLSKPLPAVLVGAAAAATATAEAAAAAVVELGRMATVFLRARDSSDSEPGKKSGRR